MEFHAAPGNSMLHHGILTNAAEFCSATESALCCGMLFDLGQITNLAKQLIWLAMLSRGRVAAPVAAAGH